MPIEVMRDKLVKDSEVIERPTVQIVEQPPRIVVERK